MIQASAWSVWPAGKCLISAETKCDVFGRLAHRRVGDYRDLRDVPVVVTDEPQVTDQCTEAVPTRKVGRIEDQSGQIAVLLDLGVDGLPEFDEVVLVQGLTRVDREDAGLGVKLELDHESILGPAINGRVKLLTGPDVAWQWPRQSGLIGDEHRISPGISLPRVVVQSGERPLSQ